MTILWITNVMLPDACEALGLPPTVVGGWLCGYRDALLQAHPEVELHIVSPTSATEGQEVKTPLAIHHLFPAQVDAAWFRTLHQQIKPDVTHIHGTEFPHSRLWIEANGAERTLVSIQGLTSVISRYYMGGLTCEELRGTWSLNDVRFRRTLSQQQRRMQQRGESEVQVLSLAQHVAGRTSWDHAHLQAINPSAHYHTLQEVLREEFYDEGIVWRLDQCQRHSIFVSQSHYPLKGLHRLLDAMPLVLRQYPDTQLYVVGEDWRPQHWRHRSQYGNVLIRKMKPFDDHVHYLGFLSAKQMIEQYRRAHLFVCPSAIENSSNSVCEAQIIGTPVIASCVGGMMDLVEHGTTGMLYRFEEVEMLAAQICQLFADDALAQQLSRNARQTALRRHDPQATAHTLFNIYCMMQS